MAKKYFIPIPRGTKPGKCKSCPATIYWAPHPTSGNIHPVSVADAESVLPTETNSGQGLSHFADCPGAAKHRR
jgi:hypothetical protein